MKSKIISMVDRLKDKEDLKLESLFGSEPIRDDGFSSKVVSRVRRRIWIQRLSLPIAFIVGGVIAVKPLSQLVVAVSKLRAFIPQDIKSNIDSIPFESLPPVSSILIAAFLVMAFLLAGKLLQE